MNLKILFIPVAIVIILVVIILYIKPDYVAMQSEKQALAVKNEQVATMDVVIGNISSLEKELSTKKDAEAFLYRYFPKELDQSRIIDAVNFLSEQTGVALASLTLEEVKVERATPEFLPPIPGALTSVNPGLQGSETGAEGSLLPPSADLPPLPTQVTLKLSAAGTYANLKEFMTRISHMDRFNTFTVIELEEKIIEREGTRLRDPVNPLLSANVEMRLDFLPETTVRSALDEPFFQQARFDLTALDVLKRWVTSPLPTLEKAGGGKANPFQK